MAETKDKDQVEAGAAQRVGPVPVAAAAGAPAPTPAPTLERPKDGRLTRAHMEEAIKSGGGVLVEGQVITRVEDLPSDVKLAEGDQARTAALASSIDAQIAALTQQRAALGGTPTVAQAPAPKGEEGSGASGQMTHPPKGR
jgi:hypothetical protein